MQHNKNMENILIKFFPVETINIGNDEDYPIWGKKNPCNPFVSTEGTITMHARLLWKSDLSFLMLSSE